MPLITADRSCLENALQRVPCQPALEGARASECDEVCPLCLSRYASARECICIACEAPSCPDCAETLPGTHDVLCYACPVPTKH